MRQWRRNWRQHCCKIELKTLASIQIHLPTSFVRVDYQSNCYKKNLHANAFTNYGADSFNGWNRSIQSRCASNMKMKSWRLLKQLTR